MSGRGRLPRYVNEGRRAYPEIPEASFVRGPPRPHPALLEEEFQLQQIEFQRLMADNRALVEEHMALQHELGAGKDEIRHLNIVMAELSAKKEAYISELIDKRMKLEADLRATEPLRNEVGNLRADIDKLIGMRHELSAKVQTLTQELARAKSDNQQVSALKSEIDNLRQELMRARTAFDFEKKGNLELLEQRKAMEKNLVSMAREIEKLRAELANSEGRPWASGGAYGMKLGSPEVSFPTSYGDSYNIHAGLPEKAPQYGPGSSAWGAFDKNRIARR